MTLGGGMVGCFECGSVGQMVELTRQAPHSPEDRSVKFYDLASAFHEWISFHDAVNMWVLD